MIADSPWQMPLAAWAKVAMRSWKESSKDNIGIAAAGVAFYGFLALVPMLAAIVLIYGILADPMTVISNAKSLTRLLPQDAAKLIGEQMMSVVQTSGGKKGVGLLIAIAVAVFGARNAAGSIITALNIAYEESERRGFLRVNMISLAITAAAVLGAVLALVAIAALGYLERLFPHLPGFVATIGKIASYLVLILAGAAAAATLYRYGPDLKNAKWRWITPGSIFSAIAWVVLTFGFGFYVANFGNYNKTYGSLATVVILLTWMYLSAYAFLFGAELNSDVEKQLSPKSDFTVKEDALSGDRSRNSGKCEAADYGAEVSNSDREDVEARQSHRDPAAANNAMDDYVTGRLVNRVAVVAGMRSVGTVSALLSTFGLSLLRKRGKEAAGASLLVAAACLSLLKRRRSVAPLGSRKPR